MSQNLKIIKWKLSLIIDILDSLPNDIPYSIHSGIREFKRDAKFMHNISCDMCNVRDKEIIEYENKDKKPTLPEGTLKEYIFYTPKDKDCKNGKDRKSN